MSKIFFILVMMFCLCTAAYSDDFIRQDGYLVDNNFKEKDIIEIKYDSAAFNELLKDHPDLQQYLDQNHNIKISLSEQNIVITENANVYQRDIDENTDSKLYAWMIIGILLIFLLATVVLAIISQFHKKLKEKL